MIHKDYLSFLTFILLIRVNVSQDDGDDQEKEPVDGEFTSNLKSYELVVPHKVNLDGEFLTFSLPNFFNHDYMSKRRRRDDCDPDVINYNLHFNGKSHHIQLWPNHGFLSPETVAEFHFPGSDMTVIARKLLRMNPALCHYTGTIKGMDGSRAALSLCDGLAGYMKTDKGIYYIEPVKDFCANEQGHHLHVVYTPGENRVKRRLSDANSLPLPLTLSNAKGSLRTNCGTREDWHEGWKRAFNRHFWQQKQQSSLLSALRNDHDRQDLDELMKHDVSVRRSLGSEQHRYLEVLVVADKLFMDFHNDKDQENYILTVMNMVSDYFHDSSTGNQLDVVVVRIIYLDEMISALDLSANPDAEHTLKSFCKWQNEINPKDPEHPQHHDIAVLITRHDICTDENKNCDLLGLAYLASACVPSDACSINEDKGLILGVVIAHQLGHIMGCQHDCQGEDGCPIDSECPAKAQDDFNHIMAPYVTLATTAWSKCSRTYMRELLDNDLGSCLSDEPHDSPYKYDEILPGAVYDADYQCSLIFSNSVHCPVDPESFCEKLFCKVSTDKCQSIGEPPADGTKCGAKRWCFKTKCVEIGERPHTVDGGWSPWSEFSKCSRTCGGGVQMSERTCSTPRPKNGGAYCTGEDKKYQICNKKVCPIGSPSFRAVQCSEFDRIPRNGKFHHWLPYFPNGADGPSTCILYCINEDHVYAKLSPRAKDGTPCRIGTMNMCLNGQCHKVGCDWVLDSDAMNDKCGVCNGDNSGCKHITGYFTTVGTGYTKVVTLPKGARNVLLRENASSENTIAIATKTEKFLLNGGNREENDGEKTLGKNLGIYVHTEPEQEELYIAGPLHQSLVFYVVFYEFKNVGYTYEYYIRDKNFTGSARKSCKSNDRIEKNAKCTDLRRATVTESPQRKYHWDFVEWSKCSVRCDGGTCSAKPTCIDTHTNGGIVPDDLCDEREKPDQKVKVCNRQACKAKWHAGEWGVCTGCKHEPGFQLRHVWCAIESPRWEEVDILTTNGKCNEQDGPKPKCKQLCTSVCTPACNRYARDTYHDAVTGNFDENFFVKYFANINAIKLRPEGVMFVMAKTSETAGSNNPYETSGYEENCDKAAGADDLPKTVQTLAVPRLRVHRPSLSHCSRPQPNLYVNPNGITVMMPITDTAPLDVRGKGRVIVESNKVKKSSDNLAKKDMQMQIIDNLKEDLSTNLELPHTSRTFERAIGLRRSSPRHIIRSERQWAHQQFLDTGQRPASMFLMEEPDFRTLHAQLRVHTPRKVRRFRQYRDTGENKTRLDAVVDRIPYRCLSVIEVPFQESTINLSDYSFEHMGDRVSGTVDLTQQKTLYGEKAVKALNTNNTLET